MDRRYTGTTREETDSRLLQEIAGMLAARPFRPHPLLRNGHAQTLAGWAWPRRLRDHPDEIRLFEVEPGVRLLARCRWHEDRTNHATLVLVHGVGGSADAPYVLGAACLAYGAGTNVVRLNQRNCGGTEHLAPTLYHSGMSGDLAAVLRELVGRDGLSRILVAGFSMGGNLALKMAGEMGEEAPTVLLGICAVSPALDLSETTRNLELPQSRLYQRSFMRGLRRGSSSVRRSSIRASTTSRSSVACAPSAISTSSTPPRTVASPAPRTTTPAPAPYGSSRECRSRRS